VRRGLDRNGTAQSLGRFAYYVEAYTSSCHLGYRSRSADATPEEQAQEFIRAKAPHVRRKQSLALRYGAYGLEIQSAAVVRTDKSHPLPAPHDLDPESSLRRLVHRDAIALALDSMSHGIADDLNKRSLNDPEYMRIEANFTSSCFKDNPGAN
jgi:hypothetical protein